jgi:hypothetical protein
MPELRDLKWFDSLSLRDFDNHTVWAEIAEVFKQAARTKAGLEESVKLQSHYADLLNMYDNGERLQFENADEWLLRLDQMKPKPKPS